MPYPQANEPPQQTAAFNPFASVDRIVATPNEPFFLCHSPRDWEPAQVHGETYWLPILHPLAIKGGSAGVRTLNKGEDGPEAYRHTVAERTSKGVVHLDPNAVIPSEFLPPGVAEGSYCRPTPCRGRSGVTGQHWHEAWKIKAASLPDEDQRWSFHRESFNKWRYHLVESGVISTPNPLIIERKVAAMRGRIGRAKVVQNPEIRADKMAAAEAASKATDGAKVPTKKRTSGRKS